VPFALGTLLSCAATIIGIVAYTNNPGDNFYFLGQDELQHRAFADLFLTGGGQSIFLNALRGEELTGDSTWGTGFVIALSEYFFGTQLAFLVLKCVLHLVATLLLYQLLKKYRSERLARYVAFFFLVYPPLQVYATSFLKDDLVASLVIITAALIDRKRYVLALVLIPLMVAIRMNSVMFPIILLAYLRRASLRQLLMLSIIPLATAVLIISQGYFEKLQDLAQLPPLTILFYVLKYLIGPLPTNILNYDTEQALIFPWYVFSFLAILASFFLRGFYASIRHNWLWIMLLVAAALGPYLAYVNDADVVGPRQFSTVGWFFFILFYEKLLGYRFVFRLNAENGTRWSPAT